MALFKSQQKRKKKSEAAVAPSPAIQREMGAVSQVIIRPHVTEKASMAAEAGVYTFLVQPKATKNDVASAVHTLFKVTPRRVAMVKIRAKTIVARGKRGATRSGKKAYVFLKKGEKIEL